jgi:hypothetical protein
MVNMDTGEMKLKFSSRVDVGACRRASESLFECATWADSLPAKALALFGCTTAEFMTSRRRLKVNPKVVTADVINIHAPATFMGRFG